MTVQGFWRSSLDPERVMNVRVTHWKEHVQEQREDHVTVEEPFEVRINHRSLAVIMRTPGHDRELAMGFLFTERVIHQAEDVYAIEGAMDDDGLPLANVVNVLLHSNEKQDPFAFVDTFERHFAVSASCGLCGKNSIDDLMLTVPSLRGRGSPYCFFLHLRINKTITYRAGCFYAYRRSTCRGAFHCNWRALSSS